MVRLSRLNGQVIAVNPDLITWIEVTPDTTLSLLGGDKVMVRETLDEVIARANSLPFGLAAYAFTNSTRTIERVFRRDLDDDDDV